MFFSMIIQKWRYQYQIYNEVCELPIDLYFTVGFCFWFIPILHWKLVDHVNGIKVWKIRMCYRNSLQWKGFIQQNSKDNQANMWAEKR